MKEQTGLQYEADPAKFSSTMITAQGKEGKTVAILSSLLGLFPWQAKGAVVSHPRDIHVLAFDDSTLKGLGRFWVKTCKAPPEKVKFILQHINVYNFQSDVRAGSLIREDYQHDLYNTACATAATIRERVEKNKGTPCVVVSSLTGLAHGIERQLLGPPALHGGKDSGGDQNKWNLFKRELFDLQDLFHIDAWHCFWEAHVWTQHYEGQGGDRMSKESIQVSGKAGSSWSFNVTQVFRLRREYGMKFQGTICDKVYFDTRPSHDFVANGRGFTENLNEKEPCLTTAFEKLGLKVGHWGATPRAQAQTSVE